MEDNKDAFIRDVYQPYHQDVYQYCLYFTNNIEEAKDLTQETFIKAFHNINTFQGKSITRTWIMAIAKNTTIDYYRKKKFQRLLPERWRREQLMEDTTVTKHVERKADWELLQHALSNLKKDYRQVVILRALKDFSVKETAEILDWSEAKVRTTYHRALHKLKQSIGHDAEGVMFYEK
ncbi:RNA polymerase sigma factor YlaC [Bacillus sp. THAF10]|uniref:RNA polymerase sigma factor n=1 Tax=Bacillus sp. THAF10 TaxID=2587848 RepID=UPI00126962DA|nr:RNA polymerase sigma factor [Bacillus sp. THAF10]QFT87289.1 RNA polymerase sigma factor YlaC [Bacillus sp. THAF10]